MSADRWSICPECKRDHDARIVEATTRADNAYGKASVEEFDQLRNAAKVIRESALEESLSEDFNIRVDEDGEFSIDYQARCECGFSFEYHVANTALEPTK